MNGTTTHELLLWLHFMALAFGGAASFGNAVVGQVAARQGEAAQPFLMPVARGLSRLGHAGLGLLILSGIFLVSTGPGWGGVGFWFWIKMMLVALLAASIGSIIMQLRKAWAGDDEAQRRVGFLGKANILLLALIVLTAAFEFG